MVDPADMLVDRVAAAAGRRADRRSSDRASPQDKVDFLILGDGYTAAERGKFEADARRLMDDPVRHRAVQERRGDFNVWGLCPPAAESGISRPSLGIHQRSPVGATYDAFGSERYVLTFENRALPRPRVAGAVRVRRDPDQHQHLRRRRHLRPLRDRRGRQRVGALHLRPRVRPPLRRRSPTSTTPRTWPTRRRPSASSRGSRTSPRCSIPPTLKWSDLVPPARRCRRPGRRTASRRASARDPGRAAEDPRRSNGPRRRWTPSSARARRRRTRLLGASRTPAHVGAFEGANYEAKGYYRPQADCIMFTRDQVPFCAVCRRAIERVIDLYAAPPVRATGVEPRDRLATDSSTGSRAGRTRRTGRLPSDVRRRRARPAHLPLRPRRPARRRASPPARTKRPARRPLRRRRGGRRACPRRSSTCRTPGSTPAPGLEVWASSGRGRAGSEAAPSPGPRTVRCWRRGPLAAGPTTWRGRPRDHFGELLDLLDRARLSPPATASGTTCPGINDGAGRSSKRYRLFNVGRARAFEERFGEAPPWRATRRRPRSARRVTSW